MELLTAGTTLLLIAYAVFVGGLFQTRAMLWKLHLAGGDVRRLDRSVIAVPTNGDSPADAAFRIWWLRNLGHTLREIALVAALILLVAAI